MLRLTPLKLLSGAALGLIVTSAACASSVGTATQADHGSGGTCDPGATATAVAFPGAGMAGAGLPITTDLDANTCGPTAADSGMSTSGSPQIVCYFQSGNTTPMAFLERIVETAENQALIHVRLTMNPEFVDNTYGANAVGWSKSTAGGMAGAMDGGTPGPTPPAQGPKPPGAGGHTYDDLVGSDKAEFVMTDTTGATVLDFFVDYISVDGAKPSGYGSLGVSGGDGKMLSGDASALIAWTTSLDRDLNACGYSGFTVDSPATDANYTPNAATPNWDYRVVYDVWVDEAAFGAAGFGDATIPYVHASPSKFTADTVNVMPGPCPPPSCETPPTTTCSANGVDCSGDGECCSGVCSEGQCEPPACREIGGACSQASDCCDLDSACTDSVCTSIAPN